MAKDKIPRFSPRSAPIGAGGRNLWGADFGIHTPTLSYVESCDDFAAGR
jgi:hypothetical protein